MTEPSPRKTAPRLVSVDLLRGVVMAIMLLVLLDPPVPESSPWLALESRSAG